MINYFHIVIHYRLEEFFFSQLVAMGGCKDVVLNNNNIIIAVAI